MSTKHSTKQRPYRILATYVTPDVEEAFKSLAEREHRSIAGELRLAIERHLEDAEPAEAA